MSIDYSKLNDQIVKQAYDHTQAFLTEAQKQKLFQNKIDRAAAMIRAQEQFRRLERENND
jgi:gamma-glutamyl phosphate reductase